jgi:nucleotide-binding universal stress UspA family protein
LSELYASQTAAGLSTAPSIKQLEKFEADLEKRAESVVAHAEQAVTKAGVQKVDSRMVSAGTRRAAKVILDDAKKWKADLIVMGTHGRSGFDHFVFGSVAEGVMRGATCPLMLVRIPGK